MDIRFSAYQQAALGQQLYMGTVNLKVLGVPSGLFICISLHCISLHYAIVGFNVVVHFAVNSSRAKKHRAIENFNTFPL